MVLTLMILVLRLAVPALSMLAFTMGEIGNFNQALDESSICHSRTEQTARRAGAVQRTGHPNPQL
jgi:hypothetical protein